MNIIKIEHTFDNVTTKEAGTMVHNESRLLELIQEHENPEQAIALAIKVFSAFLEQLEACPEPQAACPPESS